MVQVQLRQLKAGDQSGARTDRTAYSSRTEPRVEVVLLPCMLVLVLNPGISWKSP